MSTPSNAVAAKLYATIEEMVRDLIAKRDDLLRQRAAIQVQQEALNAQAEIRHAAIVQLDLDIAGLLEERRRYDGDPQT